MFAKSTQAIATFPVEFFKPMTTEKLSEVWSFRLTFFTNAFKRSSLGLKDFEETSLCRTSAELAGRDVGDDASNINCRGFLTETAGMMANVFVFSVSNMSPNIFFKISTVLSNVSFSGTSISRNMAFDIDLRSKWNADLGESPVREMPGLCFMSDFSRNGYFESP